MRCPPPGTVAQGIPVYLSVSRVIGARSVGVSPSTGLACQFDRTRQENQQGTITFTKAHKFEHFAVEVAPGNWTGWAFGSSDQNVLLPSRQPTCGDGDLLDGVSYGPAGPIV